MLLLASRYVSITTSVEVSSETADPSAKFPFPQAKYCSAELVFPVFLECSELQSKGDYLIENIVFPAEKPIVTPG